MGTCKTKDASVFRIGTSPDQSISVHFGAGKVFEYEVQYDRVKLTCKHIEMVLPVQEFERHFERSER